MNTEIQLVIETGDVFVGTTFTSGDQAKGEVVFNTAMMGYQEVITDPSYKGQMVVMTYPHIGNYGINGEDMESKHCYLDALIVKEYCDTPSNWRSTQTLASFLDENGVLGIQGIDTRALTRLIREKGALKGRIAPITESKEAVLAQLNADPEMAGMNWVEAVSSQDAYAWERPEQVNHRVAVIDCGVKHMILRHLSNRGCECQVFPFNVTADDILAADVDGVFISNGPGDPATLDALAGTISSLVGKLPIFGICMGHQVVGRALGARTYKLKFGHHGANHPVKNLRTGKVEITSQNHGFAIDSESLPEDVRVTHVNLNDQTVEGIAHEQAPIFSVQYHPESAPGPHDSAYLFDEFMGLMREFTCSPSGMKKGKRV